MTRQEKGCGEERITFIFCALESSTYDGYVKLYTATCGAAGLDTLSKPEFYYFTVSMCQCVKLVMTAAEPDVGGPINNR